MTPSFFNFHKANTKRLKRDILSDKGIYKTRHRSISFSALRYQTGHDKLLSCIIKMRKFVWGEN